MALRSKIALVCWLLLSVLAGVALHALNVWWGSLNQDEGWYLLAARSVAAGRLPYLDFAFTQGPLMPLVYSAFEPLVARYGLVGARTATAALGVFSVLLALGVAARASRRGVELVAATLAAVLLFVNVYHSYFSVIVKTYSLASVLLMAGLLTLVHATDRRKALWALFAGALLALAAGVRLSLGIALPVAGLFLLARRRHLGDGAWMLFGLGGGLGLLAVYGPFLLHAPEGLRFGLLEFHSGRDPGTPLQLLVYKAGFLSRFAQAYLVFVALGVMGWMFRKRLPGAALPPPCPKEFSWNSALWLIGFAISAVHFSAPFPYDDYQVVAFPVLAVALSVSLSNRLLGAPPDAGEGALAPSRPALAAWAPLVCGGLLLVSLFGVIGSPVLQDWVVVRRDRIWWQFKEESDIQRLRHAAALLRSRAEVGSLLLAQDAYLAVEGGFAVPPGLEMGPFSYFPAMDDGRARRLRVLNREGLIALLACDDCPVAAVSGYTAAIASPAIAPVPVAERQELLERLNAHYRPFARVEDFGQAHTELVLYEREPEREPAQP